jgi:hypothetical protein
VQTRAEPVWPSIEIEQPRSHAPSVAGAPATFHAG